jgi:hypothetical protein
MSDYDAMAEQLRMAESFASGQGVSREEVDAAENLVGRVPDDYRRFLLEFGWAEFEEFGISGLGSDAPYPHYSFVDCTLEERRDEAIPADFAVFYNNGGGDLSGFRTGGADEPVDMTVYEVVHETRTVIRHHDSFPAFVLALLHRRA